LGYSYFVNIPASQTMRTSLRLVLPLLLLSFIAIGCFDIAEDFWVNADGSARVRLDVGMSKELAAMGAMDSSSKNNPASEFDKLKEMAKGDSAITGVITGDTVIGDMHHYFVEIAVKRAADLERIQSLLFKDSSSEENKFPPPALTVTTTGNRVTMSLKMKGDAKAAGDSATKGDSSNPMAAMGEAMMASMFGNAGVTYRIHGPKIITSEGTIDSAKTTVMWKYSFANLSSLGGKTLSAEIELPASPVPPTTSNNAVYVGLLALVIIIALTVVMMRRRRK
jgi:hypothetical protein